MSKVAKTPILLFAILACTGACKPDLNKLTQGTGAEGGNAGGQNEGGSAGRDSSGGGTSTKGGASSTGGKAGSESTGGKSQGGSSAGGAGTGGTSAVCNITPYTPTGDAPSLKYDFEVEGADGTQVGGPTLSQSGRILNAISLGANQYVQLPSDVLKTMDYVTVAAWVRATSNYGTLFDFGTAADNRLYVKTGGTGISFGAQVNGGTAYEVTTNYVMPKGVWKHVALTVGDGKAALYVDGLNVKTLNVTFTPSALGSTAGNYIGHSNKDTESFYGVVDDFRIYPRVLDREELEYLAAPGTDYTHFRFDEPCGTKAYDRSSKAYVGDLPAGGTWTPNGHVGGALTLNGDNQYVTLPNDFVQSCADLTVAMWVQRTSTGIFERLFSFGKDTKTLMSLAVSTGTVSTPGPMQFSAKLNSSDVRGTGEEQLNSTTSNSPQRGIWGHVAVVLKSGGTSTLYFNGNSVASNTSITIKPSDLGPTTINTLGKPVYTVDVSYFGGTIDDLRIACRAYTVDEIKILALVDRDL